MLLQALIGGLVGRAVGPLLGALVGGVVVWFGIDLLWLRLEGDHVPMSVLATAIAVLFAKSAISKDKLTQQSKWMMAGEAWSIVLIGVYLAVVPDGIRWY
jgi:hypothetical protein